MKNKHDEGFSLIEILVAIVILTAIVVPTCSALVMSNEMNNRTDDLMKAQLAVSSAVEILMAEGLLVDFQSVEVKDNCFEVEVTIPDVGTYKAFRYETEDARFPYVKLTVTQAKKKVGNSFELMPWYDVIVSSSDGLVEVETAVKEKTEVANDKT